MSRAGLVMSCIDYQVYIENTHIYQRDQRQMANRGDFLLIYLSEKCHFSAQKIRALWKISDWGQIICHNLSSPSLSHWNQWTQELPLVSWGAGQRRHSRDTDTGNESSGGLGFSLRLTLQTLLSCLVPLVSGVSVADAAQSEEGFQP